MSIPEPSDPVLAISTDDISDTIGRLYRKPGVELPPLDLETVKKLVLTGVLVPSTTNVISVRSAESLMGWSNWVVARDMAEFALTNPAFMERLRANKRGAIEYFKLAPIRERDAAGTQGSNIHLACELIAKGESITHMNLTDYETKAVDNWKKWVDTYQPEFEHLEVTGFGTTSDGLGFGCTTDFMATINGRKAIGDYKCVVDDTNILMADGSQKKAIDIQEGDQVVAWSKEKGLHASHVTYAGDNGYHKTVTVRTTSGQVLTTTLNHPYWSSQRGKNLGWVKAEDLKVGDELYTAIGWNYAPDHVDLEWPFRHNLSPYVLGMLWAIRNYGLEDWREQHLINLPKIARDTLREELHEVGFHFNKAGQLNTRKGLAKIARKNKIEIEDVLDLFDREDLPDFAYTPKAFPGFLAGVREVFANREVYKDELYVVFRRSPEALRTLQQYLLNYGQPATIHRDAKSGVEYLKTPFESKDTIYGYGPSVTRIASITISEEAEHTVAIEVEGSHTHVTNGLITHNTNRSGLHSAIALQLSANSRASEITPDNKNMIPMPEVDLGLGIHISAKGVKTVEIDISDDVWRVFESFRRAWDFHAFDGEISNPNGVFLREINDPSEV
jgi:hypothetical protein